MRTRSRLSRGCLGTHCSRKGRARNLYSLSSRSLDRDSLSQDVGRACDGERINWLLCMCACNSVHHTDAGPRVREFTVGGARGCARVREGARAHPRTRRVYVHEREEARGREGAGGSLEANWWPDRSVRPTVPGSGRRLTESRNLGRKRRDAVAAAGRPPWPDSRLWTIDRSVRQEKTPPGSPRSSSILRDPPRSPSTAAPLVLASHCTPVASSLPFLNFPPRLPSPTEG